MHHWYVSSPITHSTHLQQHESQANTKCLLGMRESLGLHMNGITNPLQAIAFLRNIYIGQILYTLCITTIKLSVLAFYWRLFEIKSRMIIYAVTAASIAWCIAIVSHPVHQTHFSSLSSKLQRIKLTTPSHSYSASSSTVSPYRPPGT